MPTNAIGVPSLISKGDVTRALDKHRTLRKQVYSNVHVLALSWEDGGAPFDDDLDEITLLFRDCFNYHVHPYKIPTNQSQSELNCCAADFIKDYEGEHNLIIVYYSGHGGYDENKCVWAAHRSGDPTLNWTPIQSQFLNADCDVVLFLDCCFAGQAARDRKYHRAELLAATDKDQFTAIGNEDCPSFTKILIQEMKRILKDHGAVTIAKLASSMASARARLAKQPYHVHLLNHDPNETPIRLIRWKHIDDVEAFSNTQESPTEAPSEFIVRVKYHPYPDSTRRVTNWLTRDSPSFFEDIQIIDGATPDATQTQGTAIQHLGSSSDGLPTTRSSFPGPAQAGIVGFPEHSNQTTYMLLPTAATQTGTADGNNATNVPEKVVGFIKSFLPSPDRESCGRLHGQGVSSGLVPAPFNRSQSPIDSDWQQVQYTPKSSSIYIKQTEDPDDFVYVNWVETSSSDYVP